MLHTAGTAAEGQAQKMSVVLKVLRVDHLKHPGYQVCLKFLCANNTVFFLDIREDEAERFAKMFSHVISEKELPETEFELP